jgi:hypothetical protein
VSAPTSVCTILAKTIDEPPIEYTAVRNAG